MEYSFSRHDHRVEATEFDPTFYHENHAAASLTPLFRHFNLIIQGVRSLPDSIAIHLNSALKGTVFLRRGMAKQIEAIRHGHDTSHTSSSHVTVFHDILSSKLPEREKTTDRLADEALLLIGAGTETTSWTMTVATFHLLSNPSILRKLKEELQSVDPEADGHVPLATLQALPYLTATINEALRLTYGATHRLHRIFHEPLTYTPSSLAPFSPSNPQPNQEYFIPPSTPVSMTAVDLHQNPAIFPLPHSFRPERWIEDASLSKYQMAFSKGTRKCIGMNLAYAELYTCLAAVLVKFGSKEVRMNGDVGVLELVGTTEEDVRLWGDSFLPMQKPGSLGVRAVVKS
jgi:cytochrome P450